MRRFWKTLKRCAPWLLPLLAADAFGALLLWLSDAESFETLTGIILLFSFLLFAGVLLITDLRERKKQILFAAFLSKPDIVNEERLIRAVSEQEGEQLRLLAGLLRERRRTLEQLTENLRDYEEYVEGWAHEAKTPLGLLTMILDNRADEMPLRLHEKLNYVRSRLQEDVTQMLYYARLKSSTKDYRFEPVSLRDIVEEVLEDYAPLLDEKGFAVKNGLKAETVFTDRRGFLFMVGQIVSNSVKYSSNAPILAIHAEHGESEDVLCVSDNGTGVRSCDLPYIFQKGFTGDYAGGIKKATGMGLYLTKKMADDLNLKLDAKSEWKKGFSISVAFPKVREN